MKKLYSYGVLLSCAVLILAGCGARSDPLFGKYIKAADQAIVEARQRGAEKGDMSRFQSAVKLRDDAERTYMACNYYQAREMTREVVEMASLLKGPVRVVKRKAPVIVKVPVIVPVPVKTSMQKIQELGTVFFNFDKSKIENKFHPVLDEVVLILKSDPGLRIEIQGHTDGKGPAKYNQILSDARAKAIVEYFVSKGISADRLLAKGFGKSVPASTNETEEGRARNRRGQFLPTKK